MKLKSKLMGIVFGVIVFVMLCSTTVVYLLLGSQFKQDAQENFVNTANIIGDDLQRRMDKQTLDCGNMVLSTKMDEQIKFIHDFSGPDQFSLTRDACHKTVASLVQTMNAGGLWQIADYDQARAVLTYSYSQVGEEAGFRFRDPDEKYALAPTPEGAAVNSIAFSNLGQMPLQGLENRIQAPMVRERVAFFNLVGGVVCTESHVPIPGNAYNKAAEQMEEVLAGLLVVRNLGRVSQVSSRMSRLSVQVNDGTRTLSGGPAQDAGRPLQGLTANRPVGAAARRDAK